MARNGASGGMSNACRSFAGNVFERHSHRITSFVHSPAVLVSFASINVDGLPAYPAEMRKSFVDHFVSCTEPFIRLHKRPTPVGAAEGCVLDGVDYSPGR